MNDLKQQLTEVEHMAASPETLEDAVRLSGQLLAGADAAWTRAVNGKLDGAGEALRDLLDAGVCHAHCLFTAGLCRDAFAVSVMLLLAPAHTSAWKSTHGHVLALCTISYMSLLSMLDRLPDDETSHQHLPHLVRYLASMGFHAFNASANEAGVWHKRALPWLKDAVANGMVQERCVTVNGASCAPEHPEAIVGDLLGRARAMGLLDD